MNSDPIYISYVKYMEKDPDFVKLVIAKSFGALDKEIPKKDVMMGLQKVFTNSEIKELPMTILDKILVECDFDKNEMYSAVEIEALVKKVINLGLAQMRNTKIFENDLNALFDDLDKDKSGTIELGEIETYIEKYLFMKTGMVAAKEVVHNIFGVLDKDKNNKLDKKEFATMVSKMVDLQLMKLKSEMSGK